ncbi:hypothetical protein ES703_74015 [subsurface metagenome]
MPTESIQRVAKQRDKAWGLTNEAPAPPGAGPDKPLNLFPAVVFICGAIILGLLVQATMPETKAFIASLTSGPSPNQQASPVRPEVFKRACTITVNKRFTRQTAVIITPEGNILELQITILSQFPTIR